MKLISLLHFYQPYNQQADILARITHESYLPITRGLLQNPQRKVVVNITSSLLEMLDSNGHREVIDNIRELVSLGQVELTSTAKYHAILPLLPEKEVISQIVHNDEVMRKYLGDLYKPKGFFPPEMAIDMNLMSLLKKQGFEWVAVPQVASSEFEGPSHKYIERSSGMRLFFRNKRISSLILLSFVKSASEFLYESQDVHGDPYWFCVMDAETLGHHRIGHEKVFFDILDSPQVESLLIEDLLSSTQDLPTREVSVRPCTWTNQEQDFFVDNKKGTPNSFILWKDPSNPIHQAQWELTNYVVGIVENYNDKECDSWKQARNKLDYALASDQYWWASAKPWWSLEMIELGAYSLKDVIHTLSVADKTKCKVLDLYRKILDLSFEWHRTGYVRKIHLENSANMKKPLKDRTHLEWFNQVILEFEDQMLKAAKERNYELAIKWRDAVIKLKQGTDVFDILNVVDELWSVRTLPSLKPFFEYDYKEFSDFAKAHFIGVIDEEDFEHWKKNRDKRYTKNHS